MSSSPVTRGSGPNTGQGRRGTTIAAPGAQQALHRSEAIEVNADGMVGKVNRVNYLGCLIGKGAALRIMDAPFRERHLADALILATRLANLIGHLTAVENQRPVDAINGGHDAVERLRSIVRGWNPTDPHERH